MVTRPIAYRYKTYECFLIWLLFLEHLASKCIQQVDVDNLVGFKNRIDLLVKNKQSQEKLSDLFRHIKPFCGKCKDNCCLHYSSNFGYVDCIIYTININNPMVHQLESIRILLKRVIKLLTPNVINKFIRYLVVNGETKIKPLPFKIGENDYNICPLVTNYGCLLPYGRRPVVCLIFMCDQLRDNMSRGDYARYLSIVIDYLTNLTICLAKLWLELRCKKHQLRPNKT
jgi:hypothetical protein